MIPESHPILSCDEARKFEGKFFRGDEAKEWPAMQQAGRAVATGVLRDFEEIGGFPTAGKILVLVGKGHNGGDALLAAGAVLEKFPGATAEVVFVMGERMLRPLAARAWRELVHAFGRQVSVRRASALNETTSDRPGAVALPGAGGYAYDLCLDGVFGFQFRPPAPPVVVKLMERVKGWPIRLRAAVDLPSAGLFWADFTYATGIVKAPVVEEFAPQAGRVRYLDLGFFRGDEKKYERVLTPAVLAPLAALRPPHSDKRRYGHVFVVGGSRSYPGAVLMSTLAALRSGAGLVTAFVPESLVATFAARAPEAMWVGWPETPGGGLALEGQHLLMERIERATSLVIGPGMGREPETLAMVRDVVATVAVPMVIDADALQPEIVKAAKGPCVLTPHLGEFQRIGGDVKAFRRVNKAGGAVVLKGPVTRIFAPGAIYKSFFGGPVLARGGSGDILAGLTGGLLAQKPKDAVLAAVRGVVWHGLAADALARAHGQTAVQTTQVLDFLGVALRELG